MITHRNKFRMITYIFTIIENTFQFCLNSLSFSSDGIFTIKPPGHHEVKTYCDFTTEGGPWTLLLTSKTRTGWDADKIKQRNSDNPSLQNDFSILGFADAIKNFDQSQVNFCSLFWQLTVWAKTLFWFFICFDFLYCLNTKNN